MESRLVIILSSFSAENEDGEDDKETDAKDGDKDSKKDKKKDGDKKDADKKKKKEEKKKEPKKPKIESIKEPLEFTVRVVDMLEPSEKMLTQSREKLQALNEHDELKTKKETALNALESFGIEVRERLYQETYEESATDEEKEKFGAKCSEVSDWIDEEVTPDTELEPLESRLKELKELTAGWFARVREHLDRPEVLAALDQMINSSAVFLEKAKNKTGDDGYFTLTELETLGTKLEDVAKWREEEVAKQEEQPKHEMPKLTTNVIAEKALELDREVKYLLNKAKIVKAEKDKERMKKEADEKKEKEAEEKKAKKERKKKKKEANATVVEEGEGGSDSEQKPEGGGEETEEKAPDTDDEGKHCCTVIPQPQSHHPYDFQITSSTNLSPTFSGT